MHATASNAMPSDERALEATRNATDTRNDRVFGWLRNYIWLVPVATMLTCVFLLRRLFLM